MQEIDGAFDHDGFRTWYRVIGEITSGVSPLVVLHGGPGYPSYYLESLRALATATRPVILYDQLGCGRSERMNGDTPWNFASFVGEFEALLRHLHLGEFGAERVDVLGHSWGGFLALELALRLPNAVRRLVLASTSPSSEMFVRSAQSRVRELPMSMQRVIEECEISGDYANPEFVAAAGEFLARYCNRMDPLPDDIVRSNNAIHHGMYEQLWGPSEFSCTGELRDWTVADRLAEISCPVLVTNGHYDEAGADIQEFMVEKLPDARWISFPNSAHHAHLSDHAAFVAAVGAFLDGRGD